MRYRYKVKETGDTFTHFSLLAKWSRTQEREKVLNYTILRRDDSVLVGPVLNKVKLQAGEVTDRFHPLSEHAGKDLEKSTVEEPAKEPIKESIKDESARKNPPKTDAELELEKVKAELAELKADAAKAAEAKAAEAKAAEAKAEKAAKAAEAKAEKAAKAAEAKAEKAAKAAKAAEAKQQESLA